MNTEKTSPFDLKGSLFTLTVMHLYQTDFGAIDQLLGDKISQAPGFFQNVPVIIDLEALPADTEFDFKALYDLLRNRGMIPVAVRNGSDELNRAATTSGLPVLPASRAPLQTESNAAASGNQDTSSNDNNSAAGNKGGESTTANDAVATQPKRNYRLQKQPVRSGQQVYVPDGDLILLGAVSAGAEVLADGNIHIYAPLRGRALAGAKGDDKARIFCQQLEAELVAVAGNYRVIEQKDDNIWGKSVQILLGEDERLLIEPMSRSDNRLGG